MIDKDLLLEFFDVTLHWNDDKPILLLKFKENKKKKPYPIQKNGMPYSTSHMEFFMYHVEDEEKAKLLYSYRKKFFNKKAFFEWYINNLGKNQKEELEKFEVYINRINEKIKLGVKRHYESDEWKKDGVLRREKTILEKYGENYHSKVAKQHWNDPIWRDDYLKKINTPEAKKKQSERGKKWHSIEENKHFFKERCNKPERIKKISIAAKKMWADAKKNDKDKYYRMLYACKNKPFISSGSSMNSIEYVLSTLLDEFSLKWIYEPIIQYKNKTYLPDFFIPDQNLVVECYGDYWHANPIYCSQNDKIFEGVVAENIWEQDNIRKKFYEDQGFTFIYFWESDIMENQKNVKEGIQNALL